MLKMLHRIHASPRFGQIILAIILFNTFLLTLGTVTALSASMAHIVAVLDGCCIAAYVVEFLIKIICEKKCYFTSGWNIFDFSILVVALLPFSHYVTVLRALRIVRAFRMVSMFPAIKRVVSALVISIPGLVSTALLLMLVFLVFGVMGVKLFGASFPVWFGHLGRSMFSLFQIMTLESWSMGIVRPIMQVYPYAWLFFVPFILVSAFILLNFLIGIVVDAIAHLKHRDEIKQEELTLELILQRVNAIDKKLSREEVS